MKQSLHNHVVPISSYIIVYVVLIILMAVTYTVGMLPHWFPVMHEYTYFNNLVAMGVAVSKASLVIAIFMGFKFGTRLIRLFALIGFLWFSLMFIMLLDYMTRENEASKGWDKTPVNATPRIKGVPGT